METLSNQYIFITTEGETIAPNSEYPIENCQVLGIVDAENEKGAIHKLIEKNPWIEPSGFDVSQTRCIQLLTENIRTTYVVLSIIYGVMKNAIMKNVNLRRERIIFSMY